MIRYLQQLNPDEQRRHSWINRMARGIAAFFGVFSLVNLLGSLWNPWFDASHWWIRLDGAPPIIKESLLAAGAVFLTSFACKPRMSRWRRQITLVLTTILIAMAVINAVTFYALASRRV